MRTNYTSSGLCTLILHDVRNKDAHVRFLGFKEEQEPETQLCLHNSVQPGKIRLPFRGVPA